MAPVVPETANRLFQIIDSKIQQGCKVIHLLISSQGGSVFHGLSLYNYLKGIPVEIRTYNFGSADSIGVVLYCAGSKRYSVPHARFLMHGVKYNFQGQMSLDEKQLEENLKSLKIDQYNISKVIADTIKTKSTEQVEVDMNLRTTLNPEEAIIYGLVHEIKSELIPANADLSIISEPIQQNIQPIPGMFRAETLITSYSFSRHIDHNILI